MILFLFDPMDYDDDRGIINRILRDADIAYKVDEIATLEKQNLTAFSHVFFDYGGFGFGNGMAEHFEQRLIDVAQEHPSIKFVAILTMGTEWYQDILQEENVTSIQRTDLKDIEHFLNEVL